MPQTISESSSAITRSQVASTLPHLRKVISDNVSDATPILSFLMGRLGGEGIQRPGSVDGLGNGLPGMIEGGNDIRVPVRLLDNETVGSYSGFDKLDVTYQDADDYALFPIRQIAGSLTITGRELRANRGEAMVYNLVESKAAGLMESMRMDANNQAVSDGTGNGGKDILGLAAIVSTATLGGISPATRPKWQPGGFAPGNSRHGIQSGVTFSSGGLAMMHQQVNNITFGMDGPNGIFCSRHVFESYHTLTGATIQHTQTQTGDLGFKRLFYSGVSVYFDHALPNAAGQGVMYFLNSRHIAFAATRGGNFEWLDEGARPYDQDALVKILIVEGNVITDNRRMLAVTNAIT